MGRTYLVRGDTGAEGRTDHLGINVLGQFSQKFRVKYTVLLETAVFMVQVVCCVAAMLIPSGDAILAFVADSRKETDANQSS